jgi:hypothetical protein
MQRYTVNDFNRDYPDEDAVWSGFATAVIQTAAPVRNAAK